MNLAIKVFLWAHSVQFYLFNLISSDEDLVDEDDEPDSDQAPVIHPSRAQHRYNLPVPSYSSNRGSLPPKDRNRHSENRSHRHDVSVNNLTTSRREKSKHNKLSKLINFYIHGLEIVSIEFMLNSILYR